MRSQIRTLVTSRISLCRITSRDSRDAQISKLVKTRVQPISQSNARVGWRHGSLCSRGQVYWHCFFCLLLLALRAVIEPWYYACHYTLLQFELYSKCTDWNWYLNPSAIRNSIINEQCCVLSIQFANDQLTVLMTVAVARHPYYFKTVSNCMTFKISGVSYFEFVKSIMKASYRSDPLLIMLNLHSMFNILYLHSIIVLYTATRFVPACIIIHQFA